MTLPPHIIEFAEHADGEQLTCMMNRIKARLCFLPSLPDDVITLILGELNIYERICLVQALFLPSSRFHEDANRAERRSQLHVRRLGGCGCIAASQCLDVATLQLCDQIRNFSVCVLYQLPSILDVKALVVCNWSPFAKNPSCATIVSWENSWPYGRVDIDEKSVRLLAHKTLCNGCTIVRLSAHNIVSERFDENMAPTRIVHVRHRHFRLHTNSFHHEAVNMLHSTRKCSLARLLRRVSVRQAMQALCPKR